MSIDIEKKLQTVMDGLHAMKELAESISTDPHASKLAVSEQHLESVLGAMTAADSAMTEIIDGWSKELNAREAIHGFINALSEREETLSFGGGFELQHSELIQLFADAHDLPPMREHWTTLLSRMSESEFGAWQPIVNDDVRVAEARNRAIASSINRAGEVELLGDILRRSAETENEPIPMKRTQELNVAAMQLAMKIRDDMKLQEHERVRVLLMVAMLLSP